MPRGPGENDEYNDTSQSPCLCYHRIVTFLAFYIDGTGPRGCQGKESVV
jgi:hypothetical protein